MAAGLGTRLRPLTYDYPKPMVPVANRPVIEHLLVLLARHGLTEVIANTHWFPDTITGPLGDGSRLGVELAYRHEEELLGTAGGVRNVADFLTAAGDSFLVMAGDALTDVDLGALREAHAANDGIATLAVKRVANVREYGVVVADADGRIQGFQEKPDPAEALSDLASCMIYAFDADVFDHFPRGDPVDFALDVFPAMLEHDAPMYVHEIDSYWNDVGSLDEYLRGNLDAVEGAVRVEPAGVIVTGDDDPADPAPPDVPDRVPLPAGTSLNGAVLVGGGVELGAGVRIDGPAVIGPGCSIGDGARIKRSVLLPGALVPPGGLLAGAIAGRRGDS